MLKNGYLSANSYPARIPEISLTINCLKNSRTYIDYGNGKLRKGFWLNQINTINNNLKKPLVRFHAFTGNDYVSSFYRKGEKRCWKTMKKNQNFVNAFNRLGENWSIDTNNIVIATLKKFTCAIYGYPWRG